MTNILSLINYHKLRRSRLFIANREWDDEDTVGEYQSVSQLSVMVNSIVITVN